MIESRELTPALILRLFAVLEMRQQSHPDPERAAILRKIGPLRNRIAHSVMPLPALWDEIGEVLPELLGYLHLLETSSFGSPFAMKLRALPSPEEINDVLLRSIELEAEAKPERAERLGTLQQDKVNWVDGGTHPLLRAAVEGDREALTELLQSIKTFVHRYCRARLGRRNESFEFADGISEAAFREVSNAVLSSLGSASVPSVSYKISARHVDQAWQSDNTAPDLAHDTDPAGEDLADRVTHLLNSLPPRAREVLVLRVAVGLTCEQTAAALDSTSGAVRAAQHRGLARLQQEMGQLAIIE